MLGDAHLALTPDATAAALAFVLRDDALGTAGGRQNGSWRGRRYLPGVSVSSRQRTLLALLRWIGSCGFLMVTMGW